MRSLRSASWFSRLDNAGFEHRTHLKARGAPPEMFNGRPVIGIANSASDLVPCNAHLTVLAEWVSRGVLENGGYPLIFPTMSIGDSIMRPSGMLFRNLMSMELEALLRANPLDGVVLLTGCDNTAPAYMMGAASVDLPTIVVHGGAMISGYVGQRTVGSGTDIFKLYDDFRAGRMSESAFLDSEASMSRSDGHCNTMGTAATMGCLAEALGLSLPGSAAIPAVDARRKISAQLAGRRSVELVREELAFSRIVDRRALENAIRVNAALGGSTNAVLHLTALAGRLGIRLTLDDFQANCDGIPLLANLVPNGEFLVEAFYRAGGMPALMQALADRLHLDAPTVAGRPVGESIADHRTTDPRVIGTLERPIKPRNALRVLRGNLAPGGAIIKPSAASPALLRHTGRAVVFESIEDLDARIDSPDLDVDADCVLVLKGIGPRGYPGMPELGNIHIPARLLTQGVTDMVRISDGRMSGTAFGTVVLHVAPEAAVGGPLAPRAHRRQDRAGRGAGLAVAAGRRCGARGAPGAVAIRRANPCARLRAAVRRACHPGGRGHRLRFSGRKRRAGAAGAAPVLAEAATTRRCCNRQLVEEGFACDNTSAFGNLMIDASRLAERSNRMRAQSRKESNRVVKETGSTRVYTSLREQILRMELAPGAPIDEVSLSDRFGMSRSPIREALARLSSEGLVVILPNRSTVVTPIDFEGIPHFLDALDLLQRAVTRLAALRRTPADLEGIVAAAAEHEAKVIETIERSDSLPMIEANHRFHMTVAKAGKNPYYTAFYKRILDEGRRMIHIHFEYKMLEPDGVRNIAADHTEMVEAIRTRDADRAERAAHVHAAQFRGRFMEFLERSIAAHMHLEFTMPQPRALAVDAS